MSIEDLTLRFSMQILQDIPNDMEELTKLFRQHQIQARVELITGNNLKYDNCTFEHKVFTNLSLVEYQFNDVIFDDVIFTKAILGKIKFINCRFNRVSFENSFLEYISFSNCILEHVNFSNVCMISSNFQNIHKMYGVVFKGSNLIFVNSYLEDLNFQDAEIRNFELIETDVKDCCFKCTKMWSGQFINSNITYCDFSKSLIDHVNFNNLSINQTCFIESYLIDSSLTTINFDKVDLSLSSWIRCIISNSTFLSSSGIDEIRNKCEIYRTYWDNFEISNS